MPGETSTPSSEEGRHLRGRTVAVESTKSDQHACSVCKKVFASASSLESHNKIHSKQGAAETPQKRRAAAPASAAVVKKPRQSEEPPQESGVSTRSGQSRSIKCKFCDETFERREDWAEHIRQLHQKPRSASDVQAEKEQPTRLTRRSAAALGPPPEATTPNDQSAEAQLRSPTASPSAVGSPNSGGNRSRNTTLRFEEELDDGQVQCRQCQQVFNNRRGLAAHVAQKHREELDIEQRSIEEERLRKDDSSQRRRRDASRLLYGGIPQIITPQPRHISILNRRSQPSVLQRSVGSPATRLSGIMSTPSPLSSMVYPRRTTLEILTQPAPILHSTPRESRTSRTADKDDYSKGAYAETADETTITTSTPSQPPPRASKPPEPPREQRPRSPESAEDVDESAYEFSTEVTVAPVPGDVPMRAPNLGPPQRNLRGATRSGGAQAADTGEQPEVDNYPCKFCKGRVFLTSYGLERHTKMSHPGQLEEVLNEMRKIQEDKQGYGGAGYEGGEQHGEGATPRGYERFHHMDSRHHIPGIGAAAQTASFVRRRYGEKENEPSEGGDVLQVAREQSAALIAGASFTDNRFGSRSRRQLDVPRAKYQSCDICGILINTEHPKALESHAKAHQKNQELRRELLTKFGPAWVERVTCRECNLVFKDEDKLEQHRRNVHVRRRHFLCRFCGDVFRNMRDLNLHKERRHEAFEGRRAGDAASPPPPRRPEHPVRGSFDSASSEAVNGTEEFACRSMCEVCGLQMSRPSNLIRHMKVAHNRTNFTATVETRGMPPFKIDVNEGRFMWGCCDEVFDDRQAFLNHRRVAHGPSYSGHPKECEHCGLTFKTTANYVQHLRTHRPRVCNICGESFGNSVVDLNAFRAHMIRHRDQGYTVRLPPIEEELSSKEQQELWKAINEEEADDGSEDEYSVYSDSGVEYSDIEDQSSDDEGDVPMDQMTCAMCEKKFSCIYAYCEHWKLHCRQPFRENLNLKTKPFSFKQRRQRKLFKCGFCPKKFKRGATWAMHHQICTQRRRGILPTEEAEASISSGSSSRISSPTKGSPTKPRMSTRSSPSKESPKKGKTAAADKRTVDETMKDLEDQLEVGPTKKKFVPDYVEKAYIVEWNMSKQPSENPYTCQSCKQSFTNFISLVMHVKTHIQHPIEESDEEEAGDVKKSKGEKITASVMRIRPSTTEDLGKFACQVCGKCFNDQKKLNSHLDEAHRPRKQHRCNLCRRRFWTAAGLRLHERRRHNASVIDRYCGVCEKKFINNESLKAHEAKHDLENSLFQCEDCAVSFFGLKPLKDHFKANHQGVSIISCPVCYRIHTDSKALKEHFDNDHPTVRTFCTICKKSFHTPAEARQHRRRVHMKKGKLWESCTLCGKKYSNKHHLAVHLWRHLTNKSHQCRICDAGFNNDEAVRTHLEKQHKINWLDSRDLIVRNSTIFGKTGDEEAGKEERGFSCHVCGKKFDSKAAVKAHLAQGVHKRVKQIECTVCGLKFAQSFNLAAHMNRRHPQEVAQAAAEQGHRQDGQDGTSGVAEVIPAEVAQMLLNQGQVQYVPAENVQMIVDEATAAAVMAASQGAGGQEYQVLLVQGENGETIQLALGPQAQMELAQLEQQPATSEAGAQQAETSGAGQQPMEIDETNYQQFLNQ